MNKVILSVLLVCMVVPMVLSDETVTEGIQVKGIVTPLNISIVPPITIFSKPIIKGVDFGFITASAKRISGLQIACLGCKSKEVVKGIQIGILPITENDFKGLQLVLLGYPITDVPFNNVGGSLQGIQAGLVLVGTNYLKGFQISSCNYVKNDGIGIQIGIGNLAKEFTGFQCGLINAYENTEEFWAMKIIRYRGIQFGLLANLTKVCSGVQIGGLNISDKITGLQVGYINYCKYLNGVQIGILNIATKSPIPAMIGVNAAW